jgi:tetratricopeptide (TPR) repeat protein
MSMLATKVKRTSWHRAGLALAIALVASSACSKEAKIARYLERGDQYLKEGKSREAIIEFLNVIQLDERNPEATARLARTLFDTGQFGPAFQYLQRAVEFNPDDLEARVRLATLHAFSGRLEEAREEAGFALDKDPKNLDALAIFAGAASTEGEVDGAMRRLESVRSDHAGKAKFHLTMGSLQLRKRDVAGAENSFQEAARVEPDSADAHLALGTFYLAKREPARAKEEFDVAAEKAPVRSGTQIRVVDFYRLLGQPDEGDRRLDELVKEAPDFYPAWRRIALYAFTDKNYDRAQEALNHLLEASDKDPETIRMIAEVHLAKGETEEAQKRFREAIAIFQDHARRRPEQPSIHFRLAQLHVRVGEVEQAKSRLQTVVELAPNSPSAVLLLSELQINNREAAKAVGPLEDLTKRQPSALGFELLGKAYLQEQKFPQATAAFTRFSELAPSEPRARFQLGTSLANEGKLREGVRELEKALEMNPSYVEPLALLASIDARQQRLGAALSRVQDQMAKIDATGQHQFLLGQLYAASNQMDYAEVAYRKAVELDPNLNAAYAQLAQIYVRTNRIDEALAEMEKGLQHNPKNVPVMMMKGMLQHQKGAIADAQVTYEGLLGINPNFAPAANNLAYILQEKGDLERALELAELARKEAPDNPDIADTLGWILYQRGALDRALGLLKEAAAGRPQNAEILYHLGLAHHKLGQFEDTARVLKQAIALAPNSPLAAQGQTILDELR